MENQALEKLHNNPLVKNYVDKKKIIEELQERIIVDAVNAWNVVVDIAMNSNSEALKLSAAKDIMDRAGFRPVTRTDITSDGEKLPTIIRIIQPDV